MDEEERKLSRLASFDPSVAAKVNSSNARLGRGVFGFLTSLIGQVVYIEGIRINYRGMLLEVLTDGNGSPSGLILCPCERISYMEKTGPDKIWTLAHKTETLIPYEVIHHIAAGGFETWK